MVNTISDGNFFGFFSYYLSLIAKSSAAAWEGGEVWSTFQGFARRAVLLLAFLMCVCRSKLKHLATSSAVASHFAEARICVNRVLFFAWASRNWLLK